MNIDDASIRKYIRENPWEPGSYGKGIVTPTGTPYLYRTLTDHGLMFESDGWPSHAEALAALRIHRGEAGLVVIDPDGRFAFHASGARASNLIHRVEEKAPELEYRQDAYHEIY